MKTTQSKTNSQKMAGLVQTARLRVGTAENRWKEAKEHARLAKRRRKEVRLIARSAKKQAKQAKAELAEARKTLAEAEAKLAKSGVRLTTKRPARQNARTVAKVTTPIKKAAPSSKRRSLPTAPSITPAPAAVQAGSSAAAQR